MDIWHFPLPSIMAKKLLGWVRKNHVNHYGIIIPKAEPSRIDDITGVPEHALP